MEISSSLRINRAYFREIVSHLEAVFPLEGCGLLAGIDNSVVRVYPIKNILNSPVAYEMDPKQQIEAILDMEAENWEFLAIYHSHPHGPQLPSATDVARAYYPEAINIIVSLQDRRDPLARAFAIVDGRIDEVPFLIE